MRILLTAHQFLPKHSAGTEVLARDTGVELLRRGHEVNVLTVDPDPDARPTELRAHDYEYAGLDVHALQLPPFPSSHEELLWEYRRDDLAEHLREYVDTVQPDAIHVFHLLGLSGTAVEVFAEAEVPLLVTATDFWAFCYRGTLERRTGELCRGPDGTAANCLECRKAETWFPARALPGRPRRYYARLARQSRQRSEDEYNKAALVRTVIERGEYLRERLARTDAILVPTNLTRQLFLDNGFAPELVHHSPYGMDVSRFRAVRRRRGTDGPDAELRLGFIGTLAEHKGLHVLVEAFRQLPTNGRVTLRICGSPDTVPEYTRRILTQIAGHPGINFAGPFPNSEMASELDRIDALVVPSMWYENAPLVVYSALAAGVPVVATDLGGLSEFVVHDRNGLLFERGDARALAAQLSRLRDEPGLLARLSAESHEPRDVTDSVDEMLTLYRAFARQRSYA